MSEWLILRSDDDDDVWSACNTYVQNAGAALDNILKEFKQE